MQSAISCDTHGDLARVDTLRERLLGALAEADHVTLDLSELATADLSFVQLIEAARIQAEREGKTIALAAPAPDAVARIVTASGMLWDERPADLQFWFHKEVGQ